MEFVKRSLSWTLQRSVDLVFGTVFAVILGWMFRRMGRFSFLLGENAVIGSVDDEIARHLGITTQAALAFTWDWCVPVGLAVAAIWAYHLVKDSNQPDRSQKLIGLALTVFGGIALLVGIGILTKVGAKQGAASAQEQSAKPSVSDAERAAIIAPFQSQIEDLRRQIASIPRQSGPGGYLGSKPEQPVEREYTKLTVHDLRAIYGGRTRLQADAFMADEKGKLIETEGTVINVDNGMAFLQVGESLHNGMMDSVECRFGPVWNAKLGTYRQNEHMKVRGVIGPSQNGAQIYLQDCEIIG